MEIINYESIFYIEKDKEFKLVENFTYTIQTKGVSLIGSLIDFEKILQESIVENDNGTMDILEKIKLEYGTFLFEISNVEKLKNFENNGKSYFNFSRLNIKPV
ncbi:hypothetical protein K6T82_23875 [Flavobacterium sp. 17A]|uniref:Uncharacterized protein n=1 Tax=Flavobacterium potami TaxID=2872310 RepID=A0A9X1HGF3_9FLAO|nr:hypothetical protein [Flavobacterium potami]MBZ4037817.1 hypothetical protein [Flavobacterium potami]